MLELKNIKKSFSGRKILDGISFKVTVVRLCASSDSPVVEKRRF